MNQRRTNLYKKAEDVLDEARQPHMVSVTTNGLVSVAYAYIELARAYGEDEESK